MTVPVTTALDAGVLSIAFARPEKKNALTDAMYAVVADALDDAQTNEAVRVVLFRGEGDSFSAGNDIGDFVAAAMGNPAGMNVFRVLKALPEESGALAVATNIVEPVATVKTYTTANYWKSDDVNTGGYIANVSAWCTTCHTRYLSTSGPNNNADALFNYRHKSNGTTLGSANCITCHVSHGSNASMSTVAQLTGDPDGSPSASSKLLRIDNKGTCQMCHNR